MEHYNDRENERARRMRTVIGHCEECGDPIKEDPGYCASCAWAKPVEVTDALSKS